MFKKLLLVTVFIAAATHCVNSQVLQVSNDITPEQMVNTITGLGISTFNVTYSGMDIARGEFWDFSGSFGITSGIIMTSGNIDIAPGPNTTGSAGLNNGGGSDPDLVAHAGTNIQDAAVLEFDFIPETDEIWFNYVFASEEYHEYAGAFFNDVFGFFLSGPGINGTFTNSAENIARVPGSMTYVTINTVNNGTSNQGPCVNCQYFIHNSMDVIQYDAHTTVLTAYFELTASETYHMKLAVGDAADGIYDTGVFIEAGSLASTAVGMDEISQHSSVKFFPNPVKEKLTIVTDEPAVIQIYNSMGCLVHSTHTTSNLIIDVSGLPEGIYILRQTTTHSVSSKFIKR